MRNFFFFSLICHQLPDKTFSLNGLLMPLCSRCTGIYTGFLIALIFLLILGGKKKDKFPSLGISLISVIFILLMPSQVVGSQVISWLDNNHFRFLTGLLFGSSINIFLFPIFSYSLFERSIDKQAIKNWKEYFLLIVILVMIFSIHFVKISFAFYFLYYASIIGIVVAYIMINSFISSLIICWKRKKKNYKLVLSLVFLIILFFFGEIMLFRLNLLKF